MAFCLSKNYSYLCYMGNWEKQQDEKKESRERDQSRRENLGKFFYDLAKLLLRVWLLEVLLLLIQS